MIRSTKRDQFVALVVTNLPAPSLPTIFEDPHTCSTAWLVHSQAPLLFPGESILFCWGPMSEGSCSAHVLWTWHFRHRVADVKMTTGKVSLGLIPGVSTHTLEMFLVFFFPFVRRTHANILLRWATVDV